MPPCVVWPHGSLSYPENFAVWVSFPGSVGTGKQWSGWPGVGGRLEGNPPIPLPETHPLGDRHK